MVSNAGAGSLQMQGTDSREVFFYSVVSLCGNVIYGVMFSIFEMNVVKSLVRRCDNMIGLKLADESRLKDTFLLMWYYELHSYLVTDIMNLKMAFSCKGIYVKTSIMLEILYSSVSISRIPKITGR